MIDLTVVNKSNVVELDMVEKFNPYHDKLGRFTTASGATVFTWRTKDSSKQGLANRAIEREQYAHLQKEVHTVEDKIRHQDYESCAVFDKRGNELFFKDGEQSQVQFDDWEMELMPDAILTHNHPSCNTFSNDDINMIVKSGLHEIRATNRENTTYILRRTENTTADDADQFNMLFPQLRNKALFEATQELDNLGYDMKIWFGEITQEEANVELNRRLTAKLNVSVSKYAPKYNFEYEIEQR